MNITELSKSGYKLTNIFEYNLFNEINQCSETFISMFSRNGNKGSIRETYSINSTDSLGIKIINHITPYFNTIYNTDNKKIVCQSIELWRDYAGYSNGWHYDDPTVENVCIVYLDNGNAKLGTQYEEDNEIFSVSYKKNSGIVLINSNHIEHGMIGTVPADTVRRTLYLNWKIVSE